MEMQAPLKIIFSIKAMRKLATLSESAFSELWKSTKGLQQPRKHFFKKTAYSNPISTPVPLSHWKIIADNHGEKENRGRCQTRQNEAGMPSEPISKGRVIIWTICWFPRKSHLQAWESFFPRSVCQKTSKHTLRGDWLTLHTLGSGSSLEQQNWLNRKLQRKS